MGDAVSKKIDITPSVGSLSGAGRVLSFDPYAVDGFDREAVLSRDSHVCAYCDFQSKKYQEVLYVGTDSESAAKGFSPSLYQTVCPFCHQCFFLDKIERMQSGVLIWLPELDQAALNHLARAVYVARVSQGASADAAKDVLDALLSRRSEAKSRLGTDSPRILAVVMQDFLEPEEYRQRQKRLNGFRVLPLDRRIVKEGDLEFNQFPQMLAYWRSKEGPFGGAPVRSWGSLLFDFQARLSTPGLGSLQAGSKKG